MIKNQEIKARIAGAAPKVKPAKNISTRITKLPSAILQIIAGPPMSERDRYNRDVAEARAKTYPGLAGAWIRAR